MFREAVVYTINHDKRLDIIGTPQTNDEKPLTPGLPSWVPDWADGEINISPLGSVYHQSGKLFSAFKSTRESKAEFTLTNNGNSMQVSGMTMDSIPELGLVFQTRMSATQLSDLFKSWTKIARVTSRRARWFSDENTVDVFEETIFGGYIGPGDCHELFTTFRKAYRDNVKYGYGFDRLDARSKANWGRFISIIMFNVRGRRIVRLEHGTIALVPDKARSGDSIALLKGARAPLVVRRTANQSAWIVLGEAYIHGLIKGERFDASACVPITLV